MTSDNKNQTSTERALDTLRAMIFAGDLPAGSDHLETELAERLGMSRTPVREAALILAAQGLVQLRPRRGMRILPVSIDDMRDIYDVLTELESLAAERAAEAGHNEARLQPLADAIAEMDRAIDTGAMDIWAEADAKFHSELVALGNNTRIMAITEMLSDQVRRARAMTLYMRPEPIKSNTDHREVLEAIRAGDAMLARLTHRNHRKGAKEMMLRLLERHRLTQL
ncbi:GntR family transcriptional regulator [Roseobacteraceae bacterium S113]